MNRNLKAYVADNLRSCQLKQVKMLQVFDAICKKHNLTYWLDGGTLLGAVRHKGFIPWDDDLDVAMPIDDLKHFLEIVPNEIPDGLFLQTPKSDPSTKYPFAKLRDMNSLFIEFGDDFRADYQKGIYIDIFGFIPYPSVSKKTVKFYTKKISKAYCILHSYQHYYSIRSFMEFFYFGIQYILLRIGWSICRFLHSKKTYISNELSQNGYGIMHRNDSIFPVSEIEFEGIHFSAPANPDAYLKDLYNNYMQLPPEDKRIVHAIYINPELNPKL